MCCLKSELFCLSKTIFTTCGTLYIFEFYVYYFLHIDEKDSESTNCNSDDKEIQEDILKLTNNVGSRPNSICSEFEGETQTRWVDIITLPLMMAYVTRYIFGTDKLRPNAFEVRGLNGISTGIIHCDDLAILSQWLKYITDNIIGLTHLQARHKFA